MKPIDHYISFDLLRDSIPQPVYVQATNLGHRIVAAVSAGSRHNVITGTVSLVYEFADGIKSDCAMTIDNGCAVCAIPAAVTQAPGTVKAEIRIYDDNGTFLSTPKFDIIVGKAIYDADAMSQIVTSPTTYEQILASEAARVLAEQGRSGAEDARVLAENGRSSAEDARILAEAARQAAEEQRIANYADAELSETSVNPVQNKTITAALANKADATDIPTVPVISTDIAEDQASDTKTASPKAVKAFVEGKGYATTSQLPTVPEISVSVLTDKASDAMTVSPKAVYEYAARKSEHTYANNGTFSLGQMMDSEFCLFGRVSGDRKSIHTLIHTDKSMKNVTGLSVETADFQICKTDGTELYQEAGRYEGTDVSGWTARAVKKTDYTIELILTRSAGLSAAAGEAVMLSYPAVLIQMIVQI